MKTGKLLATLTPFLLIQASLSASISGAAVKPAKTLDVALMFNFNDQYNETVAAMGRGMEVARLLFQKLNPGVKVNLIRYPHDSDLSAALTVSNKVIADKRVAVIGGELSEESILLRDKFGPEKIVFITPTSSNPAVTEGHPFSFRACFSDRMVSNRMADFTYDRLKPKAIGVLHNVSSPYTDFLSKQFMKRFAERNAETKIPVYEEKVLKDAVDFDAQITRFMAEHVTHVSAFVLEGDLFKFVVQAAQKGFYPTYIGSDGWGRNENLYKLLVKESAAGEHFLAYRNYYWLGDMTRGIGKQFADLYKMTFKNIPDAWGAMAFDTAWLLLLAMNKAENPHSGDSIRQALQATRDVPLLTSSSFSFGKNDNSPDKNLFIYRIDKTGVTFEATLK